MCFAEGSIQDYHRLSGFHYRDSRRVPMGMKKILESRSNPAVLEAIERLRELGFNPVFLSSEKYSRHRLRALRSVSEVKTVLKDPSEAVGIYRKRLLSGNKAYYTHKEFCKHVEGS